MVFPPPDLATKRQRRFAVAAVGTIKSRLNPPSAELKRVCSKFHGLAGGTAPRPAEANHAPQLRQATSR